MLLKFRTGLIGAAMLASVAVGQTRVDLRTQSKSVDFGNAASTRPAKTGTTLPATCAVGELFFLSSAPAGQNLYACAGASNTWVLSSGSGTLSMGLDSTLIGARALANFVTGAGITPVLVDTGTQINISHSANTAVIQTKAAAQAGGALLCLSAGGGSAYTCGLLPTLGSYTTGMILAWKPGTNGAGGATTLNIDGRGAAGVKKADGTNPGSGDIVADRLYLIWYDGSAFRMMF